MLGPECVLVRRVSEGYRCLSPAEAAVIQGLLFGGSEDPGWLFRQCTRIAHALARGDIVMAQLYGLQIPLPDLDDGRLQQLARAAPFIKADFNPDQPRDWHGRWTEDGDAAREEHDLQGSRSPAG